MDIEKMSWKSKNNEIDEEKQNEKDEKGICSRPYNYDEAVDLAGTGGYNYTLLVTLSLTILSMGVDMFGFSVVVAGSSCDLQLDQGQKNILLSMPFVGAIIMSYPWGYLSDTQGRRKTLLIAMSGSFITATISAFSPNWIALAIFKFISTSLCSCAQSVTYALLGETCSVRARGTFMIIMTSILMMSPAVYFVLGYLVLNLDFAYDMGVIIFLPWRLLILVLALPFGVCVILLSCHYESPKFLVNAGKEKDALEILKKIYRRNGGREEFPVKQLILIEEGNMELKDVSLLESLWEQTAPLFKPPLLWRTLQLYYLIAVVYSSNNSFVMWYPFIVDMIFAGAGSTDDNGLCNMITSSRNTTIATNDIICSPRLENQTVLSSIIYSVSFTLINLCLSRLASRKKMAMISLLTVSAAAGIGANLTTNSIVSFVLFIAFLLTSLCIGFAFSFFIDLYPTSYRGMVTCLAVMVARGSALAGTNLVGAFIVDHCTTSMYAWCAYILSGVAVACFLPSDRPNTKEIT